jgi:hypothetical protein
LQLAGRSHNITQRQTLGRPDIHEPAAIAIVQNLTVPGQPLDAASRPGQQLNNSGVAGLRGSSSTTLRCQGCDPILVDTTSWTTTLPCRILDILTLPGRN